MSDDSLEMETLDVFRAPGFDRNGPRLETISPDVTIVHGPNGAGKTTLAKAAHWALWPDTAPPKTRLVAQFSANGDDWRSDVDGASSEFQRNGESAHQPSLPSREYRSRYNLALHELLQSDADSESFAELIRRESAGGYDIEAAGEALGFDDSPGTRRMGVMQDAEEAIENASEAQDNLGEIRKDQQQLEELREKREQARADQTRIELLETAIEFCEVRNELRRQCDQLRGYPSILEHIDGDELETVERLTEEIEDWEDRKNDAEKDRAEAKDLLEEADLPDEGVPDGIIEQARALQETIGELERDISRYKHELADAKSRRTTAQEDIPLDVAEEDLVSLDPAVWPDIDDFVSKSAELRAEQRLQTAVRERLGDPNRPDADSDTLNRGRNELEQWLATPDAIAEESDEQFQTVRRAGLVSAALVAVAGIALGATVSLVGYGLAILGGILFVYTYLQSGDEGTESSDRQRHRETYEELGLEAPGAWEPAAVREQLRSLYSDSAAHELADQQEQQAATLAPEDDLEQKQQALEESRQQLTESLGAAPDKSDIELLPTIKGIVRWQEANAEVQQYDARCDRLEAEATAKREELTEVLEPFFEDIEITSAEMAEGRVSALEERQEKHEAATEQLASAEGDIEDAREEIVKRTHHRARLYHDLGIDPGDTDRLRDLCDQVEDYEGILGDVSDAQARARERAQDLTGYEGEGYDSSLKKAKQRELEDRVQRLRETADDPEDLSDRISRVEERIETAKEQTAVEEALREKDEALEALEEQYETDAAAMVGHTLVEHVQEATRESSLPPVFERARELLAKITHGRYRLEMAEDLDRFRVYDSVAERGFALDDLSSGTQLQVLLAVRLAFVDQQEQGVALPLLMDETLANSDDRRASVIIDAVVELVRDGRQVLYFTAQGDEVAKWRETLETTEDIEYEIVDLAAQQDLQESVDVPSLEEYRGGPDGPSAPEGRDHASYGGALDVPAFDPRQGAGRAHLWYVVEDVDLLYELLDLGVEKWGQLRTLATETDLEAVAAEESLDDALALGYGLEEFVDAWQVGRGKYVDRHVIEEADAVTSNFEDEVAELADSLDGDGTELVAALQDGEVSRFRRNRADDLETFLIERGYIDPEDPLDPAEVRVRVMNRLVAEGMTEEAAREQVTRLLYRLEESVETVVSSADD